MNDTTPSIGDNIKSFYAEFIPPRDEDIEVANKWLVAFKDKPIKDEEAAKRCHDLIAKMKDHLAAIEERREKLKKPILDEGRLIDGQARDVKKPLEVALELLEPLESAYKKLLKARQEEEVQRAAQAAQEALQAAEAAQEKAASPTTVQDVVAAEAAQEKADAAMETLNQALAAKPIVRGDFFTRGSGLRTIWSARIDDLPAATTYYLGTALGKLKIEEVVQALANADAKKIKAENMGVPGCVGISEER